MLDLLNSEQEGFFQEIDMGQMDDEDKQFLIFDKDTGKVYDIRNERHLSRIIDKSYAKLNPDNTNS